MNFRFGPCANYDFRLCQRSKLNNAALGMFKGMYYRKEI
jgi:hypothetical protein